MKGRSLQTPALVCLGMALFGAMVAVMWRMVHHATGGVFVYALDDPYIHLELARQIAHGHYGLNPGEAASPSSSILWPYLLAPFSRFSWQVYVPLALNVAAGLVLAALLGRAVAEWPGDDGSVEEKVRRGVSVAFLMLFANLTVLAFLGMEHMLQVLLAAGAAFGMIACLQGRPVPKWCLAAATLGSLIRYEGVVLCLALSIALWGRGRRRLAAGVFGACLLPPLLFGLYLHHLGLPMLPLSVIVKGGGVLQPVGLVARIVGTVKIALLRGVMDRERWPMWVFLLMLLQLTWSEKTRARRYVFAGAALAAGIQVFVGPFGWFTRYEIYMMVFCGLLLLYVLHERPRMPLGWYVLALLTCVAPYISSTRTLPLAARSIYLQHYQMHRFTTEFYRGNVMLNDIGLVSYRRAEGQQIVDLVGLGSLESERQKNKSKEWIGEMAERHHADLAILYPSWFASGLPASWTPLGSLCIDHDVYGAASACQEFYATNARAVDELRGEFAAFIKTVPPGDVATVASEGAAGQ